MFRPGPRYVPRRTKILNQHALTIIHSRRSELWKGILLFAVSLVLTPALVVSANAQNSKATSETAFQRYDGSYFEKNSSVLEGKTSYLAMTSEAQFDKIFGPAAVMGHNTFLPAGIFDSKIVIATIRRAPFLRTYDVKKVTGSKGTVYVWYDVKDGEPGISRYKSPLILAVDKDHYTKVTFMQNGKKASTISVPRSQ
ncbi:MAG TPA: hypothetical protein VI636_14605 [Candidatus Angelobacter sp.]